MDNEQRVKQVKRLSVSHRDAIAMLLSASADIGSSAGVLLSVKKFDDAAELIFLYFEEYLTSRCSGREKKRH